MAAIQKGTPEKPRKFEIVYKDDDGSESIWKYDLDKFPNGPISVEQRYSAEYLCSTDIGPFGNLSKSYFHIDSLPSSSL